MTLIACPICRSPDLRPHRFDLGTVGGLTLRRCCGCEFIFVADSADDPVRHDHSYHAARGRVEDSTLAASNALNMLFYWSRKLRWAPDARILDVGCAEGRLLEIARAMGFRASGIDVSAYYRARWEALGLDASTTTPEELSRHRREAYDAVVSRQVIEHVRDPVSFLRACAGMVKPGGSCLIESGDAASWQARLQGRSWTFWVPAEGVGAHVSFLSRRSAAALAREADLRFVDTIPHFRYRPLVAYMHERPERGYVPAMLLYYLLHRTRLSGGRCYWFAKPTASPLAPAADG